MRNTRILDHNFFLLKPSRDEIVRNIEEISVRVREYTALFCCSDIYAVIIMAALAEKGFRIPDDLSVIGFDDNLFSKICTPRLTTVHQDADEKGRVAAKTLIGLIQGRKPESMEIRMETRLVVRGTVKKIS